MTWIVFIRDGSENKISGKADQFINFKKRYANWIIRRLMNVHTLLAF